MDSIRVEAKTVADAVTEASIQLGTSSDNIEYTVISEGSRGFFGIGGKKAVIDAKKKFTDDDLMKEVFGSSDKPEKAKREPKKEVRKEEVRKETKNDFKKDFKKEFKKEARTEAPQKKRLHRRWQLSQRKKSAESRRKSLREKNASSGKTRKRRSRRQSRKLLLHQIRKRQS